MLIELAPGSKRSGVRPPGEPIPVSRTLANVNLDEILASLDKDTRTYLQLLVAGGGQALGGNGRNLSASLKRFEPTGVLLRQVTEKVAERRENVAGAIRSFRLLSETLAGKDRDLAQLVDSSNAVFASFAKEEDRLRETLRELPPALRSTSEALTRVDALARQLGPALRDLRPAARDLGPALRESRPFLRETTPVVRSQLRPFARETLPVVRSLRPAARDLAQVTPDLTRSFRVVNSLLNTLAYDKPRDGHDSYLFWLGWANHLGNALFATQDANGPIRKGVVQVSCASLGVLENLQRVNEQLGVLVGLLNAPTVPEVCPALAAATTPAGAAPAAAATPPTATAARSGGGGG
jgi:phospholipid/cholesterol/gamma-HCH transport system substrate-binding protein